MNEPLPPTPDGIAVASPLSGPAERIVLDGRTPLVLARVGRFIQVVSGHVDIFTVSLSEGRPETARHHLFRAERGETFADMLDTSNASRMHMIAVGGADTEVVHVDGASRG